MISFSALSSVLLVFTVVINIVLAVFVRNNNPKSATNKIFTALSVFLSVWVASMYIAQVPSFSAYALFLTRLTFFLATPMNVAFFFLAHTLPHEKIRLGKAKTFALLGASLVVMAMALSPYTVLDIEYQDEGSPKPIPGFGLLIFGVFTLPLIGATILLLFRKSRSSTGVVQQQFRYVMFGILLMLGLVILTIFLPVAFFGNASLVPLAPLYTLLFLGMTAYAIVKHHFLDIRFLLARAISYSVLTACIAAIYTLSLLLTATFLLGISFKEEQAPLVVAGVIGTVIIALTFRYPQEITARITNRIFFKGRYNRDKLLSKLTHIMAGTLDLDRMTEGVLSVVTKEMRISKAAFLIVDKHRIRDIKGIHFHDHELQKSELEKLLHGPYVGNYHFIFEDLPEGNLKDLFRSLGISVAIPIRVEKTEVAILVLGQKLSGEIYYQSDIDVFDIFASEAGIAIQNASAYAEIKKFSEELERRVMERTALLEESQRGELAKAKEVAQLKDEFVFVAAHELRTPVTAINGFLELVSEAEKNFPKDVREHLSAISMASNHLVQLINDLLEVSRSESGTMKVVVAPIDLVPIIKGTVQELASVAEKKNVTIQIRNDGDRVMAMADEGKVKEVASNIIGNAIKYNRHGGHVEISMFAQGEQVIVEVRDTGYGIPKKQQEQIFQKFFRARVKETQEILGTGLGLFITRKLVEKMGGQVLFTSNEGKGSTFAFSLPKAT